MLRGGRRGRTQIVPDAWIRGILTPDADTVEAFESSEDAHELPPGAYYRNQWWVLDRHAPIYMGSGINGQTVFVHGPSKTVVAKFSTWPVAWSPEFAIPTTNALLDLARKLGDERA
jgi:hypothetical protein